MLLNILVAKEAESNYLLKKFADNTRDTLNTKKAEGHKKSFLHKILKYFLWNIVFCSTHLCSTKRNLS